MKSSENLVQHKTKLCWNKLSADAGSLICSTHEVNDDDMKDNVGEDEVGESSFR